MNYVKAVFLSEWLANPYKKLLAEHLEPYGVEVEEYRWSFFFLHKVIGSSNTKIFHLHTLCRLLISRNSLFRWLKLLIFVGQIIILRLFGIKTVWTVHEWSSKFREGERIVPPVHAAIIGKFIHAIIAHCETTKREIEQAFSLENTGKVVVIPHGNYVEWYENKLTQAECREILEIPETSLVFLLFGGIYHYKGFLEAIDAFKQLPQEGIFLLVVGNPKQEGLEEAIQEKVRNRDNILFVPKRVPDEEVQLYMNASDVVAAPYKVFTTSGVAVLAMSFGKACIVPRADYFSDVLDNKGAFFYTPNSSEDLLKVMNLARDSRDNLKTMGKYNLEVAEEWNWDFVAQETSKVYFRN